MSVPKTGYVYRSIREGDRVRRTYLGTLGDPVVQTLLESERLAKATRGAEQRKTERELGTAETMDSCLRLIQASINRAVRALRKRWRRSNQTKVRRLNMPKPSLSRDVYEALAADAADGDLDALAQIRQLLKANPKLHELLGDLSLHVQHCLVELASGGAIDVKVSLRNMLSENREELLGRGDSLPERLLVDQILTTLLDAAVCQLGFSQPHDKEAIARRWERRLAGAQARHQAAIRSLTEVRQMLETNSDTGDLK